MGLGETVPDQVALVAALPSVLIHCVSAVVRAVWMTDCQMEASWASLMPQPPRSSTELPGIHTRQKPLDNIERLMLTFLVEPGQSLPQVVEIVAFAMASREGAA